MNPTGGRVMTAFAASPGIFHRTRTGAGELVTASLGQTAMYHQAIFMLAAQAGGSMLSRAAVRRSAPGRSSGTTRRPTAGSSSA